MSSHRRQAAFSLIEILVVVVIVGIVASIALLSVGIVGDDRELQTEARRLTALVEVAQSEAVMQGREFGVEFLQSGYRFVEWDPLTNQWAELFGDDIFRQRQLPEGAEFELFLEGQRITLEPEAAEFDDPDDEDGPASRIETYAPHVFVFSSGDVTPFELRLMRPVERQEILLRQRPLEGIEIVDEQE